MALCVAAAVAVAGCAAGGPRTGARPASPTPAASVSGEDAKAVALAYLDALGARRYGDLAALTDEPVSDVAGAYRRQDERLQVDGVEIQAGTWDPVGMSMPYQEVLHLRGLGPLPLQGSLTLTAVPSHGFRVAFRAATVFPGLLSGQRVDRVQVQARGALLDRHGTPLRGRTRDLDTNVLGQVTNGRAVSGLERALEPGLLGGTATAVEVVNPTTGELLREIARFGQAAPGRDVTTTLDLRVQQAATAALATAPGVAALVAVDATTGGVLAVANQPAIGFPPALAGSYAPGSTFKVVTTLAALQAGLTPDSTVTCPASLTAGGKRFHNQEPGNGGSMSLLQAFAQSCNTAFIGVAQSLPKGSITQAAALLGFNAPPPLPLRSIGGRLPPPVDTAEAAADAIGQGRVEASPLGMASVAAAVAGGVWRQPRLSDCPACQEHPLPAGPVAALRTMMRAAVTSGTATALRAVRGREVFAKTGTAEFGSASPPATHAWMIGFQDQVAFAVYVEAGTSGGTTAGPVAARFLDALA